MSQIGLNRECMNLERIIEDLATGKEKCADDDPQYSLNEALDYLREYLQELKELNNQILEQGNTPELLKKVHDKYTELWLFGVYYPVNSLPLVVGPLLHYPDSYTRGNKE